jgi:hypothetical protein
MISSDKHNNREHKVKNADSSRRDQNKTFNKYGTSSLWENVQARINEVGAKPRKDSVLCVEHVITFSPDWNGKKLKGTEFKWNDPDKFEQWKEQSIEWIKKEYGAENLVKWDLHMDETTPHIHAFIVPLSEKERKWKRKSGDGFIEGTTKKWGLSAHQWLDGKQKLRGLQTRYHDSVKDLGLARGKEGSFATHQTLKEFYAMVNKAEEIQQEREYLKNELSQIGIDIPAPPLGLIKRGEWAENIQKEAEKVANEGLEASITAFMDKFHYDIDLQYQINKDLVEAKKEASRQKRALEERSKDLDKEVQSKAEKLTEDLNNTLNETTENLRLTLNDLNQSKNQTIELVDETLETVRLTEAAGEKRVQEEKWKYSELVNKYNSLVEIYKNQKGNLEAEKQLHKQLQDVYKDLQHKAIKAIFENTPEGRKAVDEFGTLRDKLDDQNRGMRMG